MCRTVHALLSTIICGVQVIVRIVMTTLLMIENVLRMVLQTSYNFISFMLQLVSLVPLCCVFLVSSRMKCFMCGGGGPCPINRGGACDCLMSLFAVIIIFVIFRATGVLDKIFFSIGYAKAVSHAIRFIPSTGSITECSRNDTDTEYVFYPIESTPPVLQYFYVDYDTTTTSSIKKNLYLRVERKEDIDKESTDDESNIVTMILYDEKQTTDWFVNGTNALYYLMTYD